MFWDDGDQIDILDFVSLEFSGNKTSITSKPNVSGTFTDMPLLQNLTVYGVEDSISSLQVTQSETKKVNFDLLREVLSATELGLNLLESFTISWF